MGLPKRAGCTGAGSRRVVSLPTPHPNPHSPTHPTVRRPAGSLGTPASRRWRSLAPCPASTSCTGGDGFTFCCSSLPADLWKAPLWGAQWMMQVCPGRRLPNQSMLHLSLSVSHACSRTSSWKITDESLRTLGCMTSLLRCAGGGAASQHLQWCGEVRCGAGTVREGGDKLLSRMQVAQPPPLLAPLPRLQPKRAGVPPADARSQSRGGASAGQRSRLLMERAHILLGAAAGMPRDATSPRPKAADPVSRLRLGARCFSITKLPH